MTGYGLLPHAFINIATREDKQAGWWLQQQLNRTSLLIT